MKPNFFSGVHPEIFQGWLNPTFLGVEFEPMFHLNLWVKIKWVHDLGLELDRLW